VKNSAIYYDPDPYRTIVKDDQELVALYHLVPTVDDRQKKQSSWLLRFELDNDKVLFKNLSMSMIDKKICDHF